ncbi:MAG: MBL fold metallo-hydrolase [Actinobacteria bacterium]|nr:MBL fold metallo-hydrolase [Actinomycetota bacterium]
MTATPSPAPDPTIGEDPKPLVAGVASALSPMVRRVLAPNPGMMSGPGTNTYLVGIDEVCVIDPGPADEGHLDAIVGAAGDAIRWIVATHTHIDHAPGVPGLKERTGAEVLAFGDRDGLRVDRRLGDGDVIEATEFRLEAVHTPGHAANHLCYWLAQERTLFSGDHIMQGSTVVISPPDGDMADYLASLRKVRSLRPRAIAPGHGHLIVDPVAKIDEYLAHRLARERQVLDALRTLGEAGTQRIVELLYVDVPAALHPMARRSVWAHLRKLAADGTARPVRPSDPDDPDATWAAA